MSATISITDDDIMSGLQAFLAAILPALEVVRGQDNRVSEPSAPDFAVMTPLLRSRIATNRLSFNDPGTPTGGTRGALQATRVTVQLDVHGPNSTDNTQVIVTLLRDDYACQTFLASTPGVQPLYADEPRQAAFVNGENQYEDRWIIDAVFQANPVVTTPQDFAQTVTVVPVSLDTLIDVS